MKFVFNHKLYVPFELVHFDCWLVQKLFDFFPIIFFFYFLYVTLLERLLQLDLPSIILHF